MLNDLRNDFSLDSAKVQMKAVRKTRNGALLLDVDKEVKASKKFSAFLKQTLKNTASVTDLQQKATVSCELGGGLEDFTHGKKLYLEKKFIKILADPFPLRWERVS